MTGENWLQIIVGISSLGGFLLGFFLVEQFQNWADMHHYRKAEKARKNNEKAWADYHADQQRLLAEGKITAMYQ